MNKRVLVVTPRSPFKNRGTDEQERLYAIKWLIERGYEVKVITMVIESDLKTIETSKSELGIDIIPVSYKFRNRKDWLKRLFNPLYWDGAAYEYFDPEIQDNFKNELDTFKPDLVWVDYTYLWPLSRLAKKRGMPVIIRSINFEAVHLLDEEGVTPLNLLLFLPKLMTEWLAGRLSDIVLTLNPNEVRWYRLVRAKVALVPLRFLWEKFGTYSVRDSNQIHVLFMGSSYNLSHNLRSFEFVARELAPELAEAAPGEFVFHVTGSKFPKAYNRFIDGKTVIYDGYVPAEDIDKYLNSMDVVIVPAVKHVGMQGKVFEPLARGMPVITPKANLVGYPFRDSEEVIFAQGRDEYVRKLLDIRDSALRLKVSDGAARLAKELFSREKIDEILTGVLDDRI